MTDRSKKIEETLNSLNNIQRAEASPWLYMKIRNRLAKSPQVMPVRLAWQMIVALTIVVFINLAAIRHFNSIRSGSTNGAELVANEYAIYLPQTY